MPTAASPFFWDSFSRFEQIELWLGSQPQSIKELQQNLEQFPLSYFIGKNNRETPTPLHLAVAYLADYSDRAMEAVVRKKFATASPTEYSAALADLVDFSLETDRKKMVEVSEKIIELDVLKKIYKVPPDVLAIANEVQQLAQRKEHNPQAPTSESTWRLPLSKLKTLRYLPYYSLTTLAMAYGVDLAEKPSSRWMAQSQLTFFRSTFADLIWLWKQYMALFSSARKAVIVAGSIFGSIAVIYYLYSSTYHVIKPMPSFDKQLFINLSEKAAAGLISPCIGRDKELRDIETYLSPVGNIPPRIVILLGPPGVGKTEILKGLAVKMKQRKTAHLNDKDLMLMNTANMRGKGTWTEDRYNSRVDMTLKTIEGSESQIILGLDEAHMLDKETADRLLKTEVIEKQLSLILATTWWEYVDSPLNQGPIRERSGFVEIVSLDEDNTRLVLLEHLKKTQEIIEVTPEAIDELLKIADSLPGAEPRKSKNLANLLIQMAYAAVPQEHPLLPGLRKQQQERIFKFDSLNRNRTYSYTSAGQKERAKLKLIKDTILILEKFHDQRLKLYNKIHELKKTRVKYLKELDSLSEQFSDTKDLSREEKRYVFILHSILPVINSRLTLLIEHSKKSQPKINTIELCMEEIITEPQFQTLTGPMEDIDVIIDKKFVHRKKNALTQKYYLNLKNGATVKPQQTHIHGKKPKSPKIIRAKSEDPLPHESHSIG